MIALSDYLIVGAILFSLSVAGIFLNRKNVLYNIQETTNTVRGTTSFISDKAVQPVIATVSSIAAVKAIFKSLFRR